MHTGFIYKDLFTCSICLLHVLCFLVLALENMKRKLIKDKIIEFNIYIRTEVLFFFPLEKGKDFTFLLQWDYVPEAYLHKIHEFSQMGYNNPYITLWIDLEDRFGNTDSIYYFIEVWHHHLSTRNLQKS